MPKKLDAVTDVVTTAVASETFDHYKIIEIDFRHNNSDGAGYLRLVIVPCRASGGGCFYNKAGRKVITITDPITEADANPTGVVQLFLDAAADLAAEKSSLVNTTVV